MYASEIRSWIYDDDGVFLGVTGNETVGDVTGTTNYTFTADGLIDTVMSTSEGDPHHNFDDTITTTSFASNTDNGNWLCLPYMAQTKAMTDPDGASVETPISQKIIYYDDKSTEGIIEDGVISREQVWDNNGGHDPIVTYDYDDNTGNIISIKSGTITEPDGLEVTFDTVYEGLDEGIYKKTTKTLPNGLAESTEFDIYGRAVKTTDIYNDTQTITFDDYGRVVSIEENINGTLTVTKEFDYSYDDENNLFVAEARYLDTQNIPLDPSTLTIDDYLRMQFYKDGLGRVVQTKAEGFVKGDHCWIVSGNAEYDSMGRVIREGSVKAEPYTYDGWIDTGMVAPTTEYSYDQFGRSESTTAPSVDNQSLTITKAYDAETESVTDEKGTYTRIISKLTVTDSEEHESVSINDLAGVNVRNKVKTESDYAITNMEYNLHGWAKLTESNGSTGEKQFDSLGRLLWMQSPDAGKFAYTYNDLGLVEQVTDYGKDTEDTTTRVINYNYDALNRIDSIKYSDDATTDSDIKYYYYNTDASVDKYAKGSIKQIDKGDPDNPYFSVEYNFEQLGIEEIKTIDAVEYSTKYDYDVQGRIKNVTYPDTEVVKYSYDDGGFLNHIEGEKSGVTNVYIDTIEYDQFGQRTYLKYGNDRETYYTYDENTRTLDEFYTTDADGNEILRYDYTFNVSGNITSIENKPAGAQKSMQSYTYDLMGRLTSGDGTYDYAGRSEEYHEKYEYDNDNRITKKIMNADTADEMRYEYSYLGSTHAVSSVTIANGEGGRTNIDFNYDDFGNMTRKETFVGSASFEYKDFAYDEANQLKSIDDDKNTHLDFTYDAGGQRIKKVFEDEVGVISTTTYVNGFYSIKDGAVNKHISDGNYIVATLVDNDINNIKYYHSNHIGSTAALTDKDGALWQEYLYKPYGEMWVKDDVVLDDSEIERRFTGHVFDEESGLYYMNARYYDPDIGLFMTADPSMSGANHYAYANCNPVMYSDPTGLAGIWGSGPGTYDAPSSDYRPSGSYPTSNPSSPSNSPSSGNNEITRKGQFGKEYVYDKNKFNKDNNSWWWPKKEPDQKQNDKPVQVVNNTSTTTGIATQTGGGGTSSSSNEINNIVAEQKKEDNKGEKKNLKEAGVLLLVIGGITTQADSPLPGPADVIGGGIAIVGGTLITAYYVDKMTKEIARILEKVSKIPGVQYSLRAKTDGYYPDVRTGTTYLKAGDVWKYGETTKFMDRYSTSYLNTMNLSFIPEFYGTITEIKVAEKVKIYTYFFEHGHLPPGNRIFR